MQVPRVVAAATVDMNLASDGSGTSPYLHSAPFLLFAIEALLFGCFLVVYGKRGWKTTTGLGLGLSLELIVWAVIVNTLGTNGFSSETTRDGKTDIIIWAVVSASGLIGFMIGSAKWFWFVGMMAMAASGGFSLGLSIVMMGRNDLPLVARWVIIGVLTGIFVAFGPYFQRSVGMVITTASTGSFLIFLGVDLFVNRIDGMSLGLRYLFDHNAVHKAALSAYSPPTSTRLFLGMTWLLTFVSSIFQIFVWRHAPFIRTYDSLSAFDRKSNPQLDQEGRQMAPSPNLVGTYITEGHSHDSFASRINHRYRHTAQPSDPFGSFNDKPTMRSAATEMHMPQASSFDILRGHQSMASPDEPPSPPASIVSTTFADGLQSRPPTFFDIPASQPTLSTNPSAPLFNPFPDVPVSPTDVSFNIPVVAVSAKESVQSSIPFVPPIPSSAAGARHDSSTSRSSSRSDESRRSWRKRVPDFPEPPMALSTAFPRDSVVQRDLERGLASGRNVSIAPSTNYPDLSTMLGKGSGYAGIGSGTTYPSDARVGRRKEAAEKADEIYSGTPGGNRRNPDLTTSADVVKHPSWSAMPTFAQRLSQGSGTASTNADWIGREGTPEFGHGREDSSDWNSASPVTPTAPYVTSRVVGKRSVEEGRRLAEL